VSFRQVWGGETFETHPAAWN